MPESVNNNVNKPNTVNIKSLNTQGFKSNITYISHSVFE